MDTASVSTENTTAGRSSAERGQGLPPLSPHPFLR